MAISVSFNGVVYSIPETGEESWGENVTSFLVAIPSGALQKTGGSFTLTADVNFGATFGLLSRYFSARTASPSTVGVLRLAVTDSIGWKNNSGGGNLLLGVNASDQLVFNGTSIISNAITALTGDVTATGPGSVAATIAANAVTSAKFRQSVALSVVGNATNATANVADISAGTDHFALVRSGTSLTFALLLNANIDAAAAIDFSKLAALTSGNILVGNVSNVAASVAMSGDITISNAGVTAIGANKVSNAMLRQSAGLSVIGTTGNSTANVADITAGTDNFVLRRSGTALSFGLLVNANLSGSAAITNANLATMVTATVKGNISGSTATPSDVSLVSAATASTVMLRDTNANVQANNVSTNYATTATAATTTTLTVASAKNQYFTGVTTQSCVLPDATTLPQTGFQFYIVNLSSGIVTIKDNGGSTVLALPASSFAFVTAKSISTANGSWDVQYSTNNAGGGTVTSVAMTVPTALFAASPVTGSPVTTSGTLAPTLATQTANTIFCGPTSGGAATPTFRALVAADILPINLASTSNGGITGVLPIANGGTNDNGAAWTTYTPTITANTGTFTSVSATGSYRTIGKTVLFRVTITITTNGSASVYVAFTLPVAPIVDHSAAGLERNVTGKTQKVLLISGGSPSQIRNYDNTYPGSDGAIIIVTGVYESV